MAADEQHELEENELGEGGGEESGSILSMHPEAVRARQRRKDRKGKGKTSSSSSSSSPPKPKRDAGAGDVRLRLAEAIQEIAGWVEGHDDELADVLRRDGPKQAELLGKWAEHPAAPPGIKLAVLLVAELLEPVRAFGATFRLILRRLGDRRARVREQQAAEEPWAPIIEEPEPEQAGNVVPERFRAG